MENTGYVNNSRDGKTAEGGEFYPTTLSMRRAEKKKEIKRERCIRRGGFDLVYFTLVVILFVFGLLVLASASSYQSLVKENGRSFYYIGKQLLIGTVSFILMIIVSKFNPKMLTRTVQMRTLIIIGTLAVLVVVLFWHEEINDEDTIKRWIKIGPLHFQASDVGKIGMIVLLAHYLEKYRTMLEKHMFSSLLYVFAVVGITGLVFAESALSASAMVFIIGMAMIYMAGMDSRLVVAVLVFCILVFLVVWNFRDSLHIFEERQLARITGLFDRDYTDNDNRYQTNQSVMAFALGGLFGKGLGNSFQKYLWLPESYNDFIFAIVGEELGFVGCIIVLLLFTALTVRGVMIAKRAGSMYERLLVEGISVQIAIQTFLNVLVATDVVPNTGISLPFFSSGGTAIFLQLMEMGIVLSVSRTVVKGK